VITLFAEGLAVSDASATTAPLPTVLGGLTVIAEMLGAYSANLPVFSVQLPTELEVQNADQSTREHLRYGEPHRGSVPMDGDAP
jgi:hypothetical protein